MKNKIGIIEIRSSEHTEFQQIAKEINLVFNDEGESSGLDGESIMTFSLEVLPKLLPLIILFVEKWIKKRKKIQIKYKGIMVEADSIDDLQAIKELFKN